MSLSFSKEEQELMLAELELRSKQNSFDPANPGSRPNKPQQRVLADIGKKHARWRILRWANQCLAEGTLVATARGAIPIEDVLVGDEVYDENGKSIKVVRTINSGIKECVSIKKNKQEVATCSLAHKWWTLDRNYSNAKKKETKDLGHHDRIATQWKNDAFSNGLKVDDAYFLGAFMGDGCINHAKVTDRIFISGEDEEVLEAIADVTGSSYKKNSGSNFTWTFNGIDSPYYTEHLKGKYSHEKYIPKEILQTWDRNSLCEFLAGLIDTDGSVYDGPDQSNLAFTSNCLKSIETYQWLVSSLFNIHTTVIEDERDKYTHPCYNIKVSNRFHISRMLMEIPTRIPRKQWDRRFTKEMYRFNPEGGSVTQVAAGTKVTYNLTVDGENNVYTLANGMVTSNSGKTSTPAWELSRFITNTHPHWERPVEWGDGPLSAIIAGQDRKMMELEIWEGKMVPHLKREEWHVVRSGNAISHVTHRPTGNRIIFLSHSDGSDKARRHMQGYVVHYVWIDEMPISIKIWEELEKRIVAKNGYLIATFTPKVKNEAIKRVVDNHCSQPYCTLYTASMLDNPILKDRIPEIMAQMAGYPESYRAAVIYGEWYTGDSAVYFWEDNMVCPVPDDYLSTWRHLEACDPAMQSKMGHIIFAEEPNTGTWWMISSDYIKGLDSPKAYVEEALKRTATKAIMRRVSDIATWYTTTAASEFGVSYQNPFRKTERKDELIKALQTILSEGRLKIAPECVDFINEISTCQWSETAPGRIVNGQSYHCLDAAQYGVDAFPKWDGPSAMHQDYHTAIKMAHRKQQDDRTKLAQKNAQEGPRSIMRPRKKWGRRPR